MPEINQRAIVGLVAIVTFTGYHLHAARSEPAAPPARLAVSHAAPSRAFLTEYCVGCHNQQRRTADLTLDTLDLEHVGAHAETWEKVVNKLRSGAMPPAALPRPDRLATDAFVADLEAALDRAGAIAPNPGTPAVHRLNRIEFSNAIRDLLSVEIDGKALLPADEAGYGFDNNADVLSLSTALLERYLSAARRISRIAVGDSETPSVVETFTLPQGLVQAERMSEQLPFGSRGGTRLRHHFPADGEYVVRIRLRKTFSHSITQGLANQEHLDVRLDGARIKLFTVGGECVGSQEPRCLRPPDIRGLVASEYERTADAGLEVRVPVQAGMRSLGVTFLKGTGAVREGAGPARTPPGHTGTIDDVNQEMSVGAVEIEGPIVVNGLGESASRRRIFVCRPLRAQDEAACARTILSTLARRAYRRPATPHDVQTLLAFYQAGRTAGGFETGIRFALERLLVSPNFLLRVETTAGRMPGVPFHISDVELASRLSFFLWSSIPDDELLDVAARGQLSDPKVLELQTRRMLSDARASTLVSNFASQWLRLRNLRAVAPDPQAFPDFDDSLRDAFERETELFLESQLREDRSVLELLTADYTFLNERLARFYGIPGVYGSHFRRTRLTDRNRAGLLGQASILTVTSYSTRTSPVIRGVWLLESLLGSPPPPPPPDVPLLPENGEDGRAPASMRERMQEHRSKPACAACHATMDPLGFSLENFNGIGKWRSREGNAPIDATGHLPDGTTFSGPSELRTVLLDHRREIVETLTKNLLTYAVGRGAEYYDMPAVRAIMRRAEPREFRWSSLILGIVKSLPFQMRVHD